MFDRLLPIAVPEIAPNGDFLGDAQRILESGQLTNGPFVREFEAAAAAYLDMPHCVAIANCTTALLLILKVLNLRGEVILPSFTFHATAHAVAWNGLKPVFADCDPQTFCIDFESVRSRMSASTGAILAVHLFGNPAAVEELDEISREFRVPVVYDAAHAFGASINGARVGRFGVAEVFSFSPTKLVVGGEGGLIATRDAALAQRLRAARNYGDAGDYDPEVTGLNGRMSELQAALALRGLSGLDQRIDRRNQIRLRYEERLGGVPGLTFQVVRAEARSACKDFSLIVDEAEFGAGRDWLFRALEKENIGVRRYFWPAVHRQKLYRDVWDGRPLPATDAVSDRVVSLPIYSSLRDVDVEKVCDAILRAADFAKRGQARGRGA